MCTNGVCPEHRPAAQAVSVVDDSMDLMVQQASVPNLAALFQKAKDRGVITAGKEYGSTS
jgi:hypothetical protein